MKLLCRVSHHIQGQVFFRAFEFNLKGFCKGLILAQLDGVKRVGGFRMARRGTKNSRCPYFFSIFSKRKLPLFAFFYGLLNNIYNILIFRPFSVLQKRSFRVPYIYVSAKLDKKRYHPGKSALDAVV